MFPILVSIYSETWTTHIHLDTNYSWFSLYQIVLLLISITTILLQITLISSLGNTAS